MTAEGLQLERRDVLIILVLAAATQCLYALLGVRFDASPFPGYMQFIDEPLLRERLLESLWYYHAHPPLLNLLAGIAIKVFSQHWAIFVNLCFQLLAVLILYCVYVLTLAIARSRVAATVAIAMLAVSPAFALYRNWFMYTLPSAALLTLSALLLYRYIATGRTRWCAGFFTVLATLLLTRSLFHLMWMVGVVLLLTLLLRPRARQIAVSAVVPLLIVAFWYGKNLYYFGSFSSSSMLGLGLSNITTLLVPRDELAPLVRAGELSPFALVSRYQQADLLFASHQLPATGIAVLDQVKKSSGEYNFNHQSMPKVERYYRADGLRVIREFPASYAVGLLLSNSIYFSPASMNYYFTDANREAVQPIERWFNPILYGARPESRFMEQPHFGMTGEHSMEINPGWTLFAVWWLALAYAWRRARRAVIAGTIAQAPDAVVLGFVIVTAVYLYGVSTAVELSENSRYRFLMEPLMIVVITAALTTVSTRLRRWWQSRSSSATPAGHSG